MQIFMIFYDMCSKLVLLSVFIFEPNSQQSSMVTAASPIINQSIWSWQVSLGAHTEALQRGTYGCPSACPGRCQAWLDISFYVGGNYFPQVIFEWSEPDYFYFIFSFKNTYTCIFSICSQTLKFPTSYSQSSHVFSVYIYNVPRTKY